MYGIIFNVQTLVQTPVQTARTDTCADTRADVRADARTDVSMDASLINALWYWLKKPPYDIITKIESTDICLQISGQGQKFRRNFFIRDFHEKFFYERQYPRGGNMGHVYFIRHGESSWNVEDRICGATDVPLTEKGHEQAVLAGEKFLKLGYSADEILCSPLMRAADTARHISDITGIPVRPDLRLIEQNFGIWEGTSPRNSPGFFAAKQCFINSFGTGESMFRVAQRVYNLLDELKEDKKTYILVAHNGIVRFVKSYFLDMTNEEFAAGKIGNGEIIRFDF